MACPLCCLFSFAEQGNAEKSKMVMVGDILRKASLAPGESMWQVENNIQDIL